MLHLRRLIANNSDSCVEHHELIIPNYEVYSRIRRIWRLSFPTLRRKIPRRIPRRKINYLFQVLSDPKIILYVTSFGFQIYYCNIYRATFVANPHIVCFNNKITTYISKQRSFVPKIFSGQQFLDPLIEAIYKRECMIFARLKNKEWLIIAWFSLTSNKKTNLLSASFYKEEVPVWYVRLTFQTAK